LAESVGARGEHAKAEPARLLVLPNAEQAIIDPVKRAILKGPSGQSAIVLSAWMIRTADSVPRFVTASPEEE
jgi:hypothetical protein